MSYLELHVSFSLNFALLFNVMRDKSFVLSSLKLYLIFTKEAHQNAKFQSFDCSVEISPNLYFDRLLLLIVYKIVAQKVQRSYFSWYWRAENLKKNQFFLFKMARTWWFLIRALKNIKNIHCDWSLLCKECSIWPEKVQRSYISWHWRVMQNLKKN